jgi:hypothetical protein
MAGELDRYVRWRRLPGYWFAFLFQHALRQLNSLYFIDACRLYADAQINLNQDLALSSLEIGYNVLSRWLEKRDDEQIQQVASGFCRRMQGVYRYYRRWYAYRPSHDINQLTEHLYSDKTFADLKAAFPELGKLCDRIMPDDYLKIIDRCRLSEDMYCRIVARRFLGSLYQGKQEREAALEQFRIGLEEALAVSLETEIGHFYRLCGYALIQSGRLREAAQQFEKACAYESHPAFSYWGALSVCELGDVLMKLAGRELDPSHPPREIVLAARAYKSGRLVFDADIGMGVVPVARAVKQQLFRSYADNVLEVATILKNRNDMLAEVEAAGPRYATELVAEGNAVRTLSEDDQVRFRRARAIFYQDLGAFKKSSTPDGGFSRYLVSLKENWKKRRFYLEKRNALTGPLTHAQLGDEIVEKIVALRLPDVMFLLFHVGQEQTFAALLDAGSGEMVGAVSNFGYRHWRAHQEAYQKSVQEAGNCTDPSIGMRRPLDALLGTYEDSLAQLWEAFLPFLHGKHLKIFPRLFLNEVPLHALTIDGKRLIEYCQVSYAQTLGLFLQVHRHETGSSARTLTMVCDDKGAPSYRGAIRLLNGTYGSDMRLLRSPSWQDFASSICGQRPTEMFFACHGRYNPDDPAASSLWFGESQKVPFSRIFSELDLKGCECVTLGACESGLGRTIVTAEYLGLPIAFFAAGVRYVIGTLWQVNQLAAAILLSHHYELLHRGKHTIPGALNEAQRYVMRMSRARILEWIENYLPEKAERWGSVIQRGEELPFAHPYYWAGFYIAGDV